MMYDKLSMQLLPFDRTGIRKRFRSNLTPSCRLCASSRYYPSQAGPFIYLRKPRSLNVVRDAGFAGHGSFIETE
jgi:hypothetical protein